jgi:hypothetical protein
MRAITGVALGVIIIVGVVHASANDGWQVEMTGGFGSGDRSRVESFAVFDDLLWAGVYDPTDGLNVHVRAVDPLFLVWFPAVEDGFGDTGLHHPIAMETFTFLLTPSVAISRLYVGTSATAAGGEIWATDNVDPWVQIADSGIANGANTSISAMEVFSGSLFAAGQNSTTGAEIYHFTGIAWAPADMTGGFGNPENARIEDLVNHNGLLWAATGNSAGGEIWSSPDGAVWTPAHPAGTFGGRVTALAIHDGALYAGVSSSMDYNRQAQVWRIHPGPFVQINADGFGASNQDITTLVEHNGALFAGTRSPTGAQVWSNRGGAWGQIASGGFGNSNNEAVDAMISAGKDLVVGTANYTEGGEIWRYLGIFGDGFEVGTSDAWTTTASP